MNGIDAIRRWYRRNEWVAAAGAFSLLCVIVVAITGCSTTDQTPAASAKAAPALSIRTDRNYEAQMPPRAAFDQYMADLQRNPADYIARGNIIRIYPTLDPRPAKPPEAEIWVGEAKAAIKNATGPGDFGNAANAYFKANTLAPWVPAYYYNAAVTCEKAGYPDSAAGWYEWYLITVPNDPDASNIRQHMGELKYAAAQAAKFQAVLTSLANRKWTFTAHNGLGGVMWRQYIFIVNGKMILQLSNGTYVNVGDVTPALQNSVDPQALAAHWYHSVASDTYTISPDFSTILETQTNTDGSVLTRTFQ